MTLSLQEIKEIAIQMRALMPYDTEQEKFFRHLNNGEVFLEVTEMTNGIIEELRVTITEKGLPA